MILKDNEVNMLSLVEKDKRKEHENNTFFQDV
jgi:hypothetical protein